MKHAYLAWVVLHFLLIITVSCRETLWLATRELTILPQQYRGFSRNAESVAASMLGLQLAESNLLRQTLAAYLGFAGIDAGYGYFAPNVPNSYKIVFELHYADGRSENRVPAANSGAAGLRLASLLDQIGRTHSDALREYMVKKQAAVIWREHPDVLTMHASLTRMIQPTIGDYERGKTETYELLYAYDFSLAPESALRPKP